VWRRQAELVGESFGVFIKKLEARWCGDNKRSLSAKALACLSKIRSSLVWRRQAELVGVLI
jgi:hypothetical protein